MWVQASSPGCSRGRDYFTIGAEQSRRALQPSAGPPGHFIWTKSYTTISVIRQVFTVDLLFDCCRFEVNVRSATVVGMVGAGGAHRHVVLWERRPCFLARIRADLRRHGLIVLVVVVVFDLCTRNGEAADRGRCCNAGSPLCPNMYYAPSAGRAWNRPTSGGDPAAGA